MKAWAVWLTGLPGSGKTVTSQEMIKELEKRKIKFEYLRMDEIRKILTPQQKYTEEERDYAYRTLILIAKFLTDNGINVIIDATAHRKIWRELARELIPNFFEIYIKCPIDVCMKRESGRKDKLIVNDLYKKALERKSKGKNDKSVGEVVGVDVPYEEPEKPDLVIDSQSLDEVESSKMILKLLKL